MSARAARRRVLPGPASLTSMVLLLGTLSTGAGASTPDPGSEARAGASEVRAALWSWRLGEAERLLAQRVSPQAADQRALLNSELDLLRSRHGVVIKRLTSRLAKRPEDHEARVLLGTALQAVGQESQAFKVLDALADAFNDGKIQTGRELALLGRALQLSGYPKDAREVYEDAMKAAPALVEARVWAAELYLQKYNFQAADELFQEALKLAPGDVRAQLGMARIDVESDRDYGVARERLEQLLTTHPECAPAHTLLARIELENERLEVATRRLKEQSLRLAPADADALALLGAARYLADDATGYQQAVKDALAVNPIDAGFYTVVSEQASRMHRYPEAVELARQALALNPSYWPAHVSMGIGLSRLGKDEEARVHLEQAFEGDPYNVRTYNMLRFFYDGPIREFDWVEAGPIRLRLHQKERMVLSRVMPPLVKEAWAHLVKKYGVTPTTPIHIEVFPDPETFAVRSIGLPNLGAHGICFGRVITSRSPASGDFNWAEVLWHELSHVFHIHLSKRRVPRWFSEGLAVYEATEGRPEWRREMDEILLEHRESNKLRGIRDFNLAFTRARSTLDIVVAYYHSSMVAEYIATTHGWKAMRSMLEAWGRQLDTAAVFEKSLGVASLEEFDRRFLVWLDRRLEHLAKSLRLPTDAVPGRAQLLGSAANDDKGDLEAQVRAAVAWYRRGDSRKALHFVQQAEAAQAGEPRARLVRALIFQEGGDLERAKTELNTLIEQGHDGVPLRRSLAEIHRVEGATEKAVAQLERAIAIDPQQTELYHAVVAMLDGMKATDRAYMWRRRAVTVEQAAPSILQVLLEEADRQSATKDEVSRWAEMARHVAPFSPELQLSAARALQAVGLEQLARDQAQLVLLIDPSSARAKDIVKLPE